MRRICGFRCDHGHHRLRGRLLDHLYMVSGFDLGDFSTFKWAEMNEPTRLCLLRDPLKSLEALHKAGYVHRDVALKNTPVYSLKPPIAETSNR